MWSRLVLVLCHTLHYSAVASGGNNLHRLKHQISLTLYLWGWKQPVGGDKTSGSGREKKVGYLLLAPSWALVWPLPLLADWPLPFLGLSGSANPASASPPFPLRPQGGNDPPLLVLLGASPPCQLLNPAHISVKRGCHSFPPGTLMFTRLTPVLFKFQRTRWPQYYMPKVLGTPGS